MVVVAAVLAVTLVGAGQTCIEALTVLLLAVGLFAVAASDRVSVRTTPLLGGYTLQVFLVVEAAHTTTLGAADSSHREALAVHLDTAGLFAGAAAFLLFVFVAAFFEGQAE